MITYYTVMDRCSTRTRWLVSIATLAGISKSATLPGHTAYDFFVGALEFGTAGLLGAISRTRRAYLAEVEARASRGRADHDRDVALAAAAERARIARELHDVVAHHVSLMAVQSEAAALLLPGRPAEAGKAWRSSSSPRARRWQSCGSCSGCCASRQVRLAPAWHGADALDQLARGGARPGTPGRDRRGPPGAGRPARLAPGVDLTAYRIVQEALTNTVRHSGADQAAVTVAYEPGYVTVSVADTGHGPLPARPAMNGGAGWIWVVWAEVGAAGGASGWPASPSGSRPAVAASASALARRAGLP